MSFDLPERKEATERDFLKNKIADHFLYYHIIDPLPPVAWNLYAE